MGATCIGCGLPRTSACDRVPGARWRGRDVGHARSAGRRVGPSVPLVTWPIVAPSRIDDRRAFAHRHALEADEADALRWRRRRRAGGSIVAAPGIAAGALAAGAAHLLDRPGQAGLDRRRRRVDVVAVEAQARLRGAACRARRGRRADLGLGEQGAGERFGVGGGDRDLEAVFAGVARAGHEDSRRRRCCASAPVMKVSCAERRRSARQHRCGLRPLQREQGAVGHRLDRAAAADARLQMARCRRPCRRR